MPMDGYSMSSDRRPRKSYLARSIRKIKFEDRVELQQNARFRLSSYVSHKRMGFILEDMFAEGKIYCGNITQKEFPA